MEKNEEILLTRLKSLFSTRDIALEIDLKLFFFTSDNNLSNTIFIQKIF